MRPAAIEQLDTTVYSIYYHISILKPTVLDLFKNKARYHRYTNSDVDSIQASLLWISNIPSWMIQDEDPGLFPPIIIAASGVTVNFSAKKENLILYFITTETSG